MDDVKLAEERHARFLAMAQADSFAVRLSDSSRTNDGPGHDTNEVVSLSKRTINEVGDDLFAASMKLVGQ